MQDKFPDWAPIEAVTLYRGAIATLSRAPSPNSLSEAEYAMYGVLPRRDELHLKRDLLTQPTMRAVWKSLQGRRDQWEKLARARQRPQRRFSPALELLDECEAHYAYWYAVPKISRAEAKQRLSAMAAAARDLAMSMEELPRIARLELVDLTAPDELKGIAEWLGLSDRGEPPRGSLRDWHLRRIDYPNKDTSPPGEVRFALSETLPCVPDLLRKLADRIGDVATHGAGLPQPNARKAHLHYVARQLAFYFREAYGSPLYDNVAAIAGVIFREDVEPNAIRDLMKPR